MTNLDRHNRRSEPKQCLLTTEKDYLMFGSKTRTIRKAGTVLTNSPMNPTASISDGKNNAHELGLNFAILYLLNVDHTNDLNQNKKTAE